MAGQVEGSTWGGINVPRRCLGRRWQTSPSPATTCAAEAIPRDSAVSSVHSYYSIQREPNVYGDSVTASLEAVSVRTDQTDVVTDSHQETTAWSGLNVPRRSSRWSWSPSHSTVTATIDTDTSDDFKNGNRVDNQLSPKRATQMETDTASSSWSGINVPRRSRTYGGLWGNSRVADVSTTAISVSPDTNGNHVTQKREYEERKVAVESVDSAGYRGSSPRHESQTDSMSRGSGSWGGLNVPRRAGRFGSSSSPPPVQQVQPDSTHTVQDSGAAEVRAESWGGIGVPRRTRSYGESFRYENTASLKEQPSETVATEYSTESNSSSWGGINVPKRASSTGRSYETSISPPRKQLKAEFQDTESVTPNRWSTISVPRRAGNLGKNQDSTVGQQYQSETVEMQTGDQKTSETSQTWGGLNVPRRSSRSTYSSSYTSSPRQQIQTEYVETVSGSDRKTNNYSSGYDTGRTVQRSYARETEETRDEVKQPQEEVEEEVGGYLSRFTKRTSYSYDSSKRGSPQKENEFQSVYNREESSDAPAETWGGLNVRRRTGMVETKPYAKDESQRQPYETGTTEANTENIEIKNAQSWGGINVPRRTSSLRTHRYSASPPRQQLQTPPTQPVEDIAATEHWSTSRSRGRNRNEGRYIDVKPSEVHQKQKETTVTAKDTEVRSDSWGGIDVPRRTRSIGGSSWSSSNSSRLEQPSTQQEAKTQGTNQGRSDDNSSSHNQQGWGGIGVPRRSSRYSSYSSPETQRHVEEDSTIKDHSTRTQSNIPASNIQDSTAVVEETTDTSSWSGINVPRRTRSFRSSYTSSSSSKEPTTENIPNDSNIPRDQQVDQDSSWSHTSLNRRSTHGSSSFSTSRVPAEVQNVTSDRTFRPGESHLRRSTTKSVKWSNSKSPPRCASEVTPVIRSRSRSREDLQRWSVTEVPQTERSRSLMRSRSFTSSGSRRSVSPRRSRERSTYSPSKVLTYKVDSSPAQALNWSWTPASPLMSEKQRHGTDQSDSDDVFETSEHDSRSGINVTRRSFESYSRSNQPTESEVRKSSETKETSWTGINVPRRSTSSSRLRSTREVGEVHGQQVSSETESKSEWSGISVPRRSTHFSTRRDANQAEKKATSVLGYSERAKNNQEEEGIIKWSTLEENRKRLATNYTAWEIGRSQSVDKLSTSVKREVSSSHTEERVSRVEETSSDGRWGGLDVPRRCLGYGSRWTSQTEFRQKSEQTAMGVHQHSVKSMENEDGNGTQVSEAQLVEWVEEGQDKLNKHDLKGAEMSFWKVLNNTPSVKPKTSSSSTSSPSRKRLPSILENEDELALNRPAVTALLGLAEVFTKKGRGVRHNDMEWHRMYMQAISSGQQAMTCCDHAIELSPEHKLSRWYQEQKQKSRNDLKALEDALVRSVQDRLIKKPHMIAGKMLPRSEEDIANPCNMDWLGSFRGYCKERHQTDMDWSKYDFTEEEPKEEDRKVATVVQEEPKRKKLDYKKVQDAIQKLVQQITAEMKTLKIHPGLTPEEKLNLVSPMNENYDIVKAFHKMYSIEERSEDENGNSEEGAEAGGARVNGHAAGECEIQTEDGINLGESASEKGISASRTIKHTLKGREKNLKLSLTQVSPTKLEPLMESRELKQSSSPRDFDRERPKGGFGFTTLKHGVLTVWRSYDNLEHAVVEDNLRVPAYSMEAYEELSPLTELPRAGKNGAKADEDPLDYRKPNSEGNLSVALAHVVRRLADKMKTSDKMNEAVDLYKFALGIYQDFAESSGSMKNSMAHILRNLGIIKCSKGDFISGSQLLENCITMYESNRSGDTDLLVARTWYDLGNAFLSQQWDDHVMKSVKIVMETEVKKDLSRSEDIAEDSDDDDSSAGESYWISNQEAIECYKNALAIVQKGRMDTQENVILYVELLNRIGDCSIASGNFEHAILCYEEAIYMFKTVVGSAMIELNAHALTMLGTANFLMCNYSKAVSMYETAALLHQHIYGSDEDATFEVAFTLTMLAISFYSLKHHHKSIAWCLKAFELYTNIYQDKFHKAHALQKWFVIETLYLLGFSYSTINFYDKSLHYLGISRGILTASNDGDAKQCVKILKCMADVYQSMGDEENALKFYDEALEWSGSLGYEGSATALQNQLLNRMAGVHVNSKDYDTAAKYLEQALDCQKSVENTIKDDLIGIQRQLGVTYTLAGDLDRAIECYTECHEAYEDIADSDPSDVAKNLGTLATLYHVKACLQEDNDDMFELLGTAERYYQDALKLDSRSSVSVEYANFLYHQEQCADALMAMLPIIHSSECISKDPVIEYNGVEQAILPDHMQPDVDDMENVVLQTDIFARFLGVLCYRAINMTVDAEDNLIELLKLVLQNAQALNYSLLGHAMMEMEMYQEAAHSFADSASLQHDSDLSVTNYWLALCTWVYTTIEKAVRNILVKQAEDAAKEQDHAEWASGNLGIPGIRDSGYYDHSAEDREEEAWVSKPRKEAITEEETWEMSEDTVDTPAHILELLKQQQQQEDTMMLSSSDIGYNSTEFLPEEDSYAEQTWVEEETVETPAALLELLKRQQEETDKVLERLSLSHQNLLEQDDNVDQMETGLGQRWDRHQEDMEDKSEQILQAITQRQSQLEGMLSTIKRSMENVADSDTSLNEQKPATYLTTSSTEDVRRGRLGGGYSTSAYMGRTVSDEDIRRGSSSEFRMTKSEEDLRPTKISVTQSSEDILTDALNTYMPPSRQRDDPVEESAAKVLERLGTKYNTRSPLSGSHSSFNADEDEKSWKRNRSDAPMDLSPDEDDTISRLQRYKMWAERRNIATSSPAEITTSSRSRENGNTNSSNNNDSYNNSSTLTSEYRTSRLGSGNNNSGHDMEDTSTSWRSTRNQETSSHNERQEEPMVESRAARMQRYSNLTSGLQTRNPYQPYTDSLSTSQGVSSSSYNSNDISSSQQQTSHSPYSQSMSSRRTWEDQTETQEEEHFEEVWESSEEVVETPPEILQLLRARQQVR